MRLGPAPTPPRPQTRPPREGEGTAGNAAPGERWAGRGCAARPPAPHCHWSCAPSVGGCGANAGGGAGRPRRVCLRNAESHVVLLFLVQSLGARCVTHCAAGTATSLGRGWRQQKQQPRWRCGPRVPRRTPAPQNSVRRRDRYGRESPRLRPAAPGPRLSAQPASPQAPPESPGSSGCGQPSQGAATAGAGHPLGLRCAEGAALPRSAGPSRPPRTFPEPPGPKGHRLRQASRGGGSRPCPHPLRSPESLHSGPGRSA